jgi:hypothetical protein
MDKHNEMPQKKIHVNLQYIQMEYMKNVMIWLLPVDG